MVTNILSIQSSKSNFSRAHKVGTRLDCHGNQTTLPCTTARMECLVCLSNLLLKLQHDPALFKLYDDKIKEQVVEGVVKEAPATTTSKEFCIPHKPVVKQSANETNESKPIFK